MTPEHPIRSDHAFITVPEQRFLRGLAVYALILLGLHLLAARLPASWAFFWYPAKLIGPGGRLAPREWLWGVFPYTYLAPWLQGLLAGITALGTWWMGFGRIGTFRVPAFPMRWRTRFGWGLVSWPLFWVGRTRHTRWGDAYILVKGIAHPDVRLTYNWQAPLDTYLHARLFHLGERIWGWQDALPAYWVLSTLAGTLAVVVLLALAGEMGRTSLQRWVLWGLMATLGSMQLFFGYPENYTIISLLMLTFLWLGWRFLQKRSPLWLPSLVLALAQGFHPATLFLQPAMAWLGWVAWRRQGQSWGRVLMAWWVPPLLVAGGVLALMTSGGHGLSALLGPEAPGGGDHRWWVPLMHPTGEWEYYTLFSRGHFMDALNQQLLTQPFTLFLGVWLLVTMRSTLPRGDAVLFLGWAAAAYLFLILTWNPDYGGQRDWDLFSIAAWPMTLLAGYGLIRALSPPALLRAGVILIFNQWLYTGIWVWTNTLPWEWS